MIQIDTATLVVTAHTLEMSAKAIQDLIALSALRELQAQQPSLAVPGQPPPRNPNELRQEAQAMRASISGEVQTILGMVSRFVEKPSNEPLKLAGRLAGLNGTAQELDGSTQ